MKANVEVKGNVIYGAFRGCCTESGNGIFKRIVCFFRKIPFVKALF